MFKKAKTENALLNEAIADCYASLKTMTPDTKEYAATARQIVELEKLKESFGSKKLSPDTIALIAANLVGILLILNYEKAGVVTSKTFGMIGKLR